MSSCFSVRSERGTSIVECTIVMPFLLFFAVLTLDVFRIAYEQLALTYVLTTEKRELLIGASSDPNQVRGRFAAQLSRFGVGLTSNDIVTVCPLATFDTACQPGTIIQPAADQLIVFRVEKKVHSPFFTSVLRANVRPLAIKVTGIGRSEPR